MVILIHFFANYLLQEVDKKTKNLDNRFDYQGFTLVGMTGFEPATTRPPDVYSNRAELHPEVHMREKLLVWDCKYSVHFSLRKTFSSFFQKKDCTFVNIIPQKRH